MLYNYSPQELVTPSALKRDFQFFEDIAQTTKRVKRETKTNNACHVTALQAEKPETPDIEETFHAVVMGERCSSSASSSPYVEIEDYILEGYGSRDINDSYNSRLSLDDIKPVNYCLYDNAVEEFDDEEIDDASDGKTLLDSHDEDIEMSCD